MAALGARPAAIHAATGVLPEPPTVRLPTLTTRAREPAADAASLRRRAPRCEHGAGAVEPLHGSTSGARQSPREQRLARCCSIRRCRRQAHRARPSPRAVRREDARDEIAQRAAAAAMRLERAPPGVGLGARRRRDPRSAASTASAGARRRRTRDPAPHASRSCAAARAFSCRAGRRAPAAGVDRLEQIVAADAPGCRRRRR